MNFKEARMTQSTEQERAEIEALARRKAWRYKKSSDPHHSDTYTFNTHTLHDFADALLQAARRTPAEQAQRLQQHANSYGEINVSNSRNCVRLVSRKTFVLAQEQAYWR